MRTWYVSRAVRLPSGGYFVVEGTDPWNRLALEPGLVGEHARWWLKTRTKYQRWPLFRLHPPDHPITTVRWIELGPYDRAIAWLVTLYALRCAFRRR